MYISPSSSKAILFLLCLILFILVMDFVAISSSPSSLPCLLPPLPSSSRPNFSCRGLPCYIIFSLFFVMSSPSSFFLSSSSFLSWTSLLPCYIIFSLFLLPLVKMICCPPTNIDDVYLMMWYVVEES